jgi:hypothetical protein
MSKTDYAGIDYSMGNPTVNRDPGNGVSYGLISLHSLGEFATEEFEPVYYHKVCTHCGEDLAEDFDECNDDVNEETGLAGNQCPSCKDILETPEDIYPDEADSWIFEDPEYSLMLSEQNEVWVFKSPFVTRAQYCSPCAPGAGNLDSPCDKGPLTYALGPEWFEDETTPYAVSRVDVLID